MRIREPVAKDFPAICAITNHYIETSAIHFAYQPVSASELEANWIATRDRYPWRVAELDQVVAYAKAGEWRSRDAYRWTTEVGLYVDHAHRGAGIGKVIYQDLLTALQAAGFRSAIGGITLPNEASVALHRSLGFEPVGIYRDAGWKHGAWHDVAFYQLRLRQDPGGPEQSR